MEEATLEQLKARMKEAVETVTNVMSIDGEQHKVWALDNIVQVLAGEDYDSLVENFQADTGKKWNRGIEP